MTEDKSLYARLISRLSMPDYLALPGVSITRLKEIERSPQHFLHAQVAPAESPALTLGTAAHTASLEPERFERDFAVWGNRTASGRQSPRNGKMWDAFCVEHAHQVILTDNEARSAGAIAAAVRFDPIANAYLAQGDPEVALQWMTGETASKGRIDWLTKIDGTHVLVGLKTTRDCRASFFGRQAAQLMYTAQWAYYHDGFVAITFKEPRLVEIVVESEPPHAVAVYRIPNDILELGREQYERMLARLALCKQMDEWPGPQPRECELVLPPWAYPTIDEDITELGLIATT